MTARCAERLPLARYVVNPPLSVRLSLVIDINSSLASAISAA